MTNLIVFAAPLMAGFVLLVVADRRGWKPSLVVAVTVGISLRLAALFFAWRFSVQPYDFWVDFPAAADNIMKQQDPILNSREGGWHFPPLMAYLLAGQAGLGEATGMGWAVAGRLVPIVADLVLMVLVGRLSTHRQSLRRFQWACNPLAIMVCAVHGQTEPIALALGVGALLAARHRQNHAVLAGILIGLSITTNNWPVLLLPGILLALPLARQRLACLAWGGLVPAAFVLTQPLILRHSHLHQLPAVVAELLNTRPVVGTWGWTALVTGGRMAVDPVLGSIGTLTLLAGITAAMWWWRRADPLTLTVVILLVFLVLTHRLGAQYLLWPLPYLLAWPTRGTPYLLAATSVWAGIGYFWLSVPATEQVWEKQLSSLALGSLALIPLLLWAIPWQRRIAQPSPAPPTSAGLTRRPSAHAPTASAPPVADPRPADPTDARETST